MNGSGKQSFYEIQLNNASLIAAFLIAVGLGVAVFMLGVMVGRGQAPETPVEGRWAEESFTADDEQGSEDTTAPEFFEKVQETDEADSDAATVAEPEREPPVTEQEQEETPPVRSTDSGLPAADPSLPPGSGWVVQVKATPQRSEAAELQAALATAGFDAFIEEQPSGNQTVYRVRVGRYAQEADARRVESALADRPDVSDTWVTRG